MSVIEEIQRPCADIKGEVFKMRRAHGELQHEVIKLRQNVSGDRKEPTAGVIENRGGEGEMYRI